MPVRNPASRSRKGVLLVNRCFISDMNLLCMNTSMSFKAGLVSARISCSLPREIDEKQL